MLCTCGFLSIGAYFYIADNVIPAIKNSPIAAQIAQFSKNDNLPQVFLQSTPTPYVISITIPATSTTIYVGQNPTLQPVPTQFNNSCIGSLLSKLAVGMRGRVTITSDHLRSRVRTKPGTDTLDTIIERLPDDTRFEVIGGFQCVENERWWQIRTQFKGSEIVGWMEEVCWVNDQPRYCIEPAPNTQ